MIRLHLAVARTGGLLAAGLILAGIASCAAPTTMSPNGKVSVVVPAPPPAPDYAQASSWLSKPSFRSKADIVPNDSGVTDDQATAKVDVFFLHPTTYFGSNPNARYNEAGMTEDKLENGVIRGQASVFNGCCRIYAPHYRQATLSTFMSGSTGERAQAALDLAYSDVVRAFDYYIEHDNHGRPFVLAGHSQGSILGTRLLAEHIAGTPLMKQLVAAYLIGSPVSIDNIGGIAPCTSPTETGCFLGWNTVSTAAGVTLLRPHEWVSGRYMAGAGGPAVCVNPLTGTLNGTAPASANLGAIPPGLKGSKDELPKPIPGLTGATCTSNYLVVDIPENAPGDWIKLGASYHLFDYSIFYMSIRKDAITRAETFLKKNPS